MMKATGERYTSKVKEDSYCHNATKQKQKSLSKQDSRCLLFIIPHFLGLQPRLPFEQLGEHRSGTGL